MPPETNQTLSPKVYDALEFLSAGLSKVATAEADSQAQIDDLEIAGWEVWLKTLAPDSFTAPFSDEHREFWDKYWILLQRQKRHEVIEAKDRAFILPFGRGVGKSSTAEMAAIMEGCILGTGYCLYLSDSQLLAEEHLYSVKAILENGIFSQYYPNMASPEMQSSVQGKSKYTQDTIITNNGKWGMTARGLTANVRGGRIGTLRFTLVVNDDIDNLTDSLMVIEKKKRIISRTVFPAMAKEGKTILAQNLITKNSIASQILDRKTDILAERTVIGGKAVKAFKELELEQVFSLDGTPRWKINKAVPTWEYFNLEDARSFLALSGKEAFLAEYQHEFDERSGKVIPNYNEDAQLITWSMFEKVFGEKGIPKHWRGACGLDVGFSDGMHPHYSYWGFVAVSAMNSKLPGKHFVYRGRAFKGMAIDDQAVEIWRELLRDEDYHTDLKKYTGLTQYLDVPREYRHEKGGILKHFQMSHEATGVMMTLKQKYGLPFTKISHYKATDGVAQWNNLSRCDYTQPSPFKEDELLEDGTYLIGCPSQFYVVDDDQYQVPRDERGLKLLREQVSSWEYVQTKILESGLTDERPSKIQDDSCFVAGTLIRTVQGEKSIENIQVGELVQTRQGYQPVIASGVTSESAIIYELTTNDGRVLRGTASHPIYVEGKGFTSLKAVRENDKLVVWQKQKSFGFKALNSLGIQNQNTPVPETISLHIGAIRKTASLRYIGKCGSSIRERFQAAITSITRITTEAITLFPTLNVLAVANIPNCTILRSPFLRKNLYAEPLPKVGQVSRRGDAVTRDASSIAPLALQHGFSKVENSPYVNLSVLNVEKNLKLGASLENSVARNAGNFTAIIIDLLRRLRAFIVKKQWLFRKRAQTENIAVSSVRMLAERHAIYNLSVANVPEYFANGILVHNCDVLKSLFFYFGQPATPLTYEEKIVNEMPATAVEMLKTAKTASEKLNAQIVYEFERDFAESKVNPGWEEDLLE